MRDLLSAAEGAPAPALHRVDAARDPARARRARRHRAARPAGRGVAAGAVGAPTRRAGSASSGSTTSPGRCCAPRTTYAGWCARPPRTTSATAAGGWRSRSTRAGTPPGSAGSPPSPTWCSTRSATPRSATGLGDGGRHRRQPHPAPARRPHPGPARRRSTPAAGVVGFGLSNDERRGSTADFAAAFRDRRAGRAAAGRRTAASCAVPSTSGSASTRCTPTGSATASAPPRTRRCSTGSSTAGVALEVCPVSNVALGVYSDLTSVPLPHAARRPAPTVALGADDPLLFGSRLAGQYATMRAAHDLTDEQLAELARMSVRASRAPDDVRDRDPRRHRRVAGSPTPATGWRHDDRPREPVRRATRTPRRTSRTAPRRRRPPYAARRRRTSSAASAATAAAATSSRTSSRATASPGYPLRRPAAADRRSRRWPR